MNKLTIIMACYNNPDALAFQHKSFFEYYNKLYNIILIDDCSSRSLYIADYPFYLIRAILTILIVKKDIPWNQPACKNIGMLHTETEWNILTDIDHRFDSGELDKIQIKNLAKNKIYAFKRKEMGKDFRPHKNPFLIHRDTFKKTGGYDTDFCGNYAYDDSIYFKYVRSLNIPIEELDIYITTDGKYTKGNKDIDREINRRKYNIKSEEIKRGTYRPNNRIDFEYEIQK